MINKAHIKIGDVVYGSSDSVDIMYDENTNVYDKITNMSNTMAYIDIEDNENIENLQTSFAAIQFPISTFTIIPSIEPPEDSSSNLL